MIVFDAASAVCDELTAASRVVSSSFTWENFVADTNAVDELKHQSNLSCCRAEMAFLPVLFVCAIGTAACALVVLSIANFVSLQNL